MNKEKLEKAANDFARGYSFNDETLKDCSFYSYVAGARWLQSRPLADRLTEEEREKIKEMYVDLIPLKGNMPGIVGQMILLEDIFGKELFENNE